MNKGCLLLHSTHGTGARGGLQCSPQGQAQLVGSQVKQAGIFLPHVAWSMLGLAGPACLCVCHLSMSGGL